VLNRKNTIYKNVTKLKSTSKCDDLYNYKEIERLFFPSKRNILTEYSLLKFIFIFSFWRNFALKKKGKKKADWHQVFSF